jgi:toxin secretion/phage lysis holin
MKNTLSCVAGLLGGVFCSLLGGWDLLLRVLMLCIILDYTTGVLKAAYTHKLSSSIGYKGIIRKVFILAVVALGNAIGLVLEVELHVREIVITFFIANEGFSILENAVECGLPVPKIIVNILSAKSEKEKNKDINDKQKNND